MKNRHQINKCRQQSLLKKITHRIMLLTIICLLGVISSIVISSLLIVKRIDWTLEQISEEKIGTFQVFFQTLITSVLRNRILARDATTSQEEQLLRQIRWRNPAILDILLVQNDGKVIAQSSRSLRPKLNKIQEQPWLHNLQDVTQVWFGLVTYELNNYSVTMVVKLTDELGLPYDNVNLVTRIDLNELLRQLTNTQGKENNIYIIDQINNVNRIILHRDIRLLQSHINSYQIDFNNLERLTIEQSPSQELVFAYHKRFDIFLGEKWLDYLDNLVWVVTIEQPFLDTIYPFIPIVIVLILVLIIIIIIIVYIFVFIKKRVIEPIKNLQLAIKQINNNQFDLELTIENNDELGELYNGFNKMTKQLKESFETLETRVQERTIQLEKANQVKREFIGNINHELRTPLNHIIGYSERLYQDNFLNSEQKKQLEIINNSSQHLLSLINQILDISKIEAGQMRQEKNSFNLSQLLTNVQEMFALNCRLKGLEFAVENNLEEKLNYIYADKKKLKQILINLLNNAIKFTEKGSVRIVVYQEDGGYFNSSNNENYYDLILQIKDTGKGISPQEISKLFKPFEQTETGRNIAQGSGLGLYITHQFIEVMEGKITVDSLPDIGTTFTIKIPVELVKKETILSQTIPQKVIGLAPNQPHYRILVVDDDLPSGNLLVNLLSSIGLSVQVAYNGQQAISLWEEWQPHLIWMELELPIMDGFKAIESIKNTTTELFPYIIVLTADASENVRQKALSSGCDDFVAKPFQRAVIWEKMRQYLGLQYVYKSDTKQTQLTSHTEVNPTVLEQMPQDWLNDLYEASLYLQGKKVLVLIKKIEDSHPSLAQFLQPLAENYRFDKITALIDHYYSTHT
ncbi:hybrid sensor histidine kinase/response regulator [Cyanothece sp. BG0011]|uniref:hybrid sensor histidine kinase/response regulator n=1 Tax=Cyanothece sp. BG0011 TaxID=2082950 RepID=UPI000D1E0415|nr:hybrid sensor histidine kinase/response regulator [Cyanothece sp. BG0011]